MKKRPTGRHGITERFIEDVCSRLARDKRVRRTLPGGGRLHVDRQLPFLCVYRQPSDRPDGGTRELVTAEASFLIVSDKPSGSKAVSALVRRIAETMAARFGAFLIVEVWSAAEESQPPDGDEPPPAAAWKPGFRIAARGPNRPRTTVDVLARSLRRIRIQKQPTDVEILDRRYGHPPRRSMLVPVAEAESLGCHVIGLEVRPVYRDPASGELFPRTLRYLRRRLSRALKQALFTFTRVRTNVRPEHYYALGRRAMVKAVWEVDRRLAEVSDSFDFLLQATPVNPDAAWREFKQGGFQRTPVFHYRPLAVEPGLLKRKLFAIPIEQIEDPTLAELFREKQDELDRKLTMLSDIGTRRFLPGSLQVYGPVEPWLRDLAAEILATVPARTREPPAGRQLSARRFAERARQEVEQYREQYPDFQAGVTVRDDLYSGLLVSGSELLVGRDTKVPAARVEALLQHEVGTHLVTHFNGRAQPFRQLASGLAGYDGLQEGLAVLSEYLVGGLTRSRLRLLAARVVAVDRLVHGAPFADTFTLLWRTHGFAQWTAFTIAMRVYRAGGLTKDAVYLRGLVELQQHLAREEHELEPLFVGKIAVDHLPLMRELSLRQVLRPPPLRPRYLDNPLVMGRLARFRQGIPVRQFAEEATR